MGDPKVVHSLPSRYWRTFREVRTRTADGLQWFYLWECRKCAVRLKPNTAGAQSHIAKHLRDTTKKGGGTSHVVPGALSRVEH